MYFCNHEKYRQIIFLVQTLFALLDVFSCCDREKIRDLALSHSLFAPLGVQRERERRRIANSLNVNWMFTTCGKARKSIGRVSVSHATRTSACELYREIDQIFAATGRPRRRRRRRSGDDAARRARRRRITVQLTRFYRSGMKIFERHGAGQETFAPINPRVHPGPGSSSKGPFARHKVDLQAHSYRARD